MRLITRINNNTTPQDRDENPGKAGARKYGVVRTRMVLDANSPYLLRFEIYNPRTNQWEEMSDEVIDHRARLADLGLMRHLTIGFLSNGMHSTTAVPEEHLGPLRDYVVEWLGEDELPGRIVMVNEAGVEVRLYRVGGGGGF